MSDHCRFPTPDGPCQVPVSGRRARCADHEGLDAVEAATALGAEARRSRRAASPAAVQHPSPISDEQLATIARVLNQHEVAYVLIGGAAAQLHGAPVARTRDADVVPSRTGANLDRLANALRALGARLWVATEPEGLAMVFDRTTLGQVDTFLNLITAAGPLDITYRPEGTGGYDDLVGAAVVVSILDVGVPVAALEDVIRSKEAAGRAKDVAVLPVLIEYARRRGPST